MPHNIKPHAPAQSKIIRVSENSDNSPYLESTMNDARYSSQARYLAARALTLNDAARWGFKPGIDQGRPALIATKGQRRRIRFTDGRGKKARWDGVGDTPAFDTCGELVEGQPVYVANGEWGAMFLTGRGLVNVIHTYGEGSIHKALPAVIEQLKAPAVHIWPDNDKMGRDSCQALYDALPAGITYQAHELPATKPGYDLNDWAAENPGANPLELPVMELARTPAPVKAAPRMVAAPTDIPDDAKDLYRAWCEYVERHYVTQYNIAPPNDKGFSRRAFKLREEQQASAYWDYERHGIKDFGGLDSYHNTHEAAELAGLLSWESYRAQYGTTRRKNSPLARATEELAINLIDPVISIGLSIVRREGLTEVSVPILSKYTKRHTAVKFVTLGEEFGFLQKSMHIAATGDALPVKDYAQDSAKITTRGRPSPLYSVVGEATQDAIREELARRVIFERAYKNVPADTAPVVGDLLTEDQIARADIARADIYKKHEEARATAAAAVTGTKIDLALPLDLPEEAYQNARAWRAARLAKNVAAAGGQRQQAIWKGAQEIGVSEGAYRKICASAGLVRRPDFQSVPLETGDLVEDFSAAGADWALARPAGVWIKSSDGKEIRVTPNKLEEAQNFVRVQMERGKVCAARVQRASVEKFDFLATDSDRAAIQEQEARNQECAKRRHENKATTAPPRRLLPFIIRQAAYSLPAGVRIADGELSVTDRATGEIARHELTPLTAWLAVIDELPAPVLEAAPVMEVTTAPIVEAVPLPAPQEAATAPEEGQKRGTPAPQHSGPWEAVERAAGHALEVIDRYATTTREISYAPPPERIEAERRRIARQEADEERRKELARNYRPAFSPAR